MNGVVCNFFWKCSDVGGPPIKKSDEERGMGGRQVISNSHAAVRDGRPPPIPEEPEIPKDKEEKSKEKSVLQAKLTKLAIQIGYAGINQIISWSLSGS